jgi:hypothetical protein
VIGSCIIWNSIEDPRDLARRFAVEALGLGSLDEREIVSRSAGRRKLSACSIS